MRRIRARVLAPLLLLLTAAPAGAQMPLPGAGPILFVRAEIEDAEYLGGLDNQTAQDSEPFIDGADYRVKLKITDVLIGKTEQTDIYLTLTITDAPQGEAHPDIFLLVEQEPGGQIDPIDWDYAENGVCIDDQTAEAYGIEKAVAEIQSKYPCTADD